MITIRPISKADIPGFHAALDSVCRERSYLAMVEAPPLEGVRSFVNRNLEKGVAQFVALEKGRVVGWCDVLPGDTATGTAHVGHLGMGVINTHRRRGLGRRLAKAAIRESRRHGFLRIELNVFASNIPAIGLYRKLGFVEEGRKIRGRMVDGVFDDVVLMALLFDV